MNKKFFLDNTNCPEVLGSNYEQKKLFKLRKEVNELFFLQGLSKNAIAKKKRISKHFVLKWTKEDLKDHDFASDNRGWPMGKLRKWNEDALKRVKELHTMITENPRSFYSGATAIESAWRRQYPDKQVPPLRTIGKMLKDLGLSNSKRGRQKGASRYLCYPEHTIYNTLGQRVLESDFVGQKYLQGRTEPIHFIGFSFKKPPKLRYFKRVDGATANSFISECQKFFQNIEKPDCIKIDNAAATIGSRSGKRNISRAMNFLLGQEVMPIFSVPRRPFSQASIEGNNSVFARKFWKQRTFTSLDQIDEQLTWFNQDSRLYSGYMKPHIENKKTFEPKIYFLRQVRSVPDTDEGYIDVLNEIIPMPTGYISYFVLAEWNLDQEKLHIFIEQEKELKLINQLQFLINKTSKSSLKKSGALSSCI